MKLIHAIIAVFILVATGCGESTKSDYTTVKVLEVEQVSGYTYMLVKAKGPEYWVAVPTMQANPGETYYHKEGMVMKDFYSKDLDRTFEEVLFLESLAAEEPSEDQEIPEMTPGSMVTIEKSEVKVQAGEGSVTIADLYADPSSFEGKTIKVKGEVTKFNLAIMERNWIHLQDGTEFEGKFDLTATSAESFEVGTVVTIEGVLALNRDFGFGYTYELLLEEATAVSDRPQ